ncbi:MAG: hypothetical protein ACLP05_05665 [Candidatus Kryptoniota bacterium]
MGQQQLLLIVLGVIIVGIAIAVGISMFKSNAQSANRDAVIADLDNLAAKAQQYFRKPTSMAGGGQSFAGFVVGTLDSADGNGAYWATSTKPAAFVAYPGNAGTPWTADGPGTKADTLFYLIGIGTEAGNDGVTTDFVEAFATVDPNGPVVAVLN